MIDVDLQGDHKAQKLMVTELTRSMSAKSIARSIFPKVSVLKKSLKMQYMLLLLEKILDEVNKLIFYISIIEILAWGLGFLWFLAYPSGMALIWFHLIHVPRGAFGLFIVMKKSPKAYEIIEEISEFDSNEMKENWNFEQMVFHVRNNFKKNISILITVIPFVIFPPSKKFLTKNFVRCHFPPPEFKHIMFKNYVFCYIILIKLNKNFKIIFQKIFCWPLSFSPLTKICKIATFWGKMTKGITVIILEHSFWFTLYYLQLIQLLTWLD